MPSAKSGESGARSVVALNELQLRPAHQTSTRDAGGYKVTPAMAAGVANHMWTFHEIAALRD
jgi:hypothetical protein